MTETIHYVTPLELEGAGEEEWDLEVEVDVHPRVGSRDTEDDYETFDFELKSAKRCIGGEVLPAAKFREYLGEHAKKLDGVIERDIVAALELRRLERDDYDDGGDL